jgi:hypothetical protein
LEGLAPAGQGAGVSGHASQGSRRRHGFSSRARWHNFESYARTGWRHAFRGHSYTLTSFGLFTASAACSGVRDGAPAKADGGRFRDQQRQDMLGCCGSVWMHAPHLNRLAASGCRFNAAFTTTPVCTPARTALGLDHFPAFLQDPLHALAGLVTGLGPQQVVMR